MRRMVVSGILLTLVLVMGQTVFAGDEGTQTLRITISPVTGAPGMVIDVAGTGAVADTAVALTLAPQPESADGAFVTRKVSPAAEGTFSAKLTVPDDLAEGHYFVRAEQFSAAGNVLQYYWNGFIVGAPVATTGALLPETGARLPGTSLGVTAVFALLFLGGMILRGVYTLVVR